jgi:hypothetical protein
LIMKSAHFLLMMSMMPSIGQRHRWLHFSGIVASLVDSCYVAINFVV